MPDDSLPLPIANPPSPTENRRTDLGKEAQKQAFLHNLFCMQGTFPALATKRDDYLALVYTARDCPLQRWISTAAEYTKQGSRTVAYLPAEFLMGPHLGNNLVNLGIDEPVREAIAELGLDIEALMQKEEEPGMRYEFGIFDQEIVNGRSRRPTSGCASAIRGKSCAPSGRRRCPSAAAWSVTPTSAGACAHAGSPSSR
jgi:glucan phosphorylase